MLRFNSAYFWIRFLQNQLRIDWLQWSECRGELERFNKQACKLTSHPLSLGERQMELRDARRLGKLIDDARKKGVAPAGRALGLKMEVRLRRYGSGMLSKTHVTKMTECVCCGLQPFTHFSCRTATNPPGSGRSSSSSENVSGGGYDGVAHAVLSQAKAARPIGIRMDAATCPAATPDGMCSATGNGVSPSEGNGKETRGVVQEPIAKKAGSATKMAHGFCIADVGYAQILTILNSEFSDLTLEAPV